MIAERLSSVTPSSESAALMSGDEAIAFAALDAGIGIATGYPGTPATDIQATLQKHADPQQVKVIWSVNEKVAYESALGMAIGGIRALVSMKQVGLNVAADAFMNSCPGGTNGGLVLAVGDDPECHSSQNKQDTRFYRDMSGVLLLEPADPQEAYDMTREAFIQSERLNLPVILRLTARTALGFGKVVRRAAVKGSPRLQWPKEPGRFFIVPQVSRKRFKIIANQQSEMESWLSTVPYTKYCATSTLGSRRLGILTTGIGWHFAKEHAPVWANILKVAGEPFPDDKILDFVTQHDRVVVLEEGDPILERRALLLTKQSGTVIQGRLSGDLKQIGELVPEEIEGLLWSRRKAAPVAPVAPVELPPRLPEICKPCGYHVVFKALQEIDGLAVPADIGCNSLGGLPPYSVMDGVWAMGSSLGVACGLAAAGHPRIVAIIGDSTFFHAGIPPLIEAIHERYKMTVLLLDNGTAAMTGGQGVAHRTHAPTKAPVSMVKLIEALGVQMCTPFRPHAIGVEGVRSLIEQSFGLPGVKVLLYQSPCGVYAPDYFALSQPATVA